MTIQPSNDIINSYGNCQAAATSQQALESELEALVQQIIEGRAQAMSHLSNALGFDEANKLLAEAEKATSIVSTALLNGQTSLSSNEKDQLNNVIAKLQDQIPKILADEESKALSPSDAALLLQLCQSIIVQGKETISI